MNLHSLKYVNGIAKKKNGYAATYRQARIALLQLSDTEELQDFLKLESSDLYAKNAAGARGLGEGSVTDSWIWMYGRLKGMSDADKNDFCHASK